MKVYILYADPHDEGATIYGVFSTVRKAATARKLFSSKSRYELLICGMELDELEKHFERAKSPEKLYHASRHKMSLESDFSGTWNIFDCGLDSFLENREERDQVVEFFHFQGASVLAVSEEEALKKVEKMIEEGKVLR